MDETMKELANIGAYKKCRKCGVITDEWAFNLELEVILCFDCADDKSSLKDFFKAMNEKKV